ARWFAPGGLVAPVAGRTPVGEPARTDGLEGAAAGAASDVETASREPVPATAGPRPDEGGMPASGR
ncbi:hypothetical protein NSA53_15645, partial [Cellulosimicrobium cellulans]|uniref:hypothetical protein n=1 Tax=Cellulosimicrobium cellulans TaxID=1710 RepID=UPI002149E199|nr:hypothetical protein [Cellulosimicrobium cellulans]